MNTTKLIEILTEAKKYVAMAGSDAEERHDDSEGELYMDGAQYEIMKETENLTVEIDEILNELTSTHNKP